MATHILMKDVIDKVNESNTIETAHWLKSVSKRYETASNRSFSHVVNNAVKIYPTLNKNKGRPGFSSGGCLENPTREVREKCSSTMKHNLFSESVWLS